jgi:hypothetical protein
LKLSLKNVIMHQYSNRYVIRKKSDDTCINPKIKHRIHEGMCQVLHSQLGGLIFGIIYH